MRAEFRPAAQYIRMSTDRQDLSPLVQREFIERFARDNNFRVICTYEDQGRSGVRISNRPALRKLMCDVVERADFHAVLVYDVSRWGRFQDADASAYYEYHCRLHGVQVIYVAEPFGEAPAPLTALLKSMKRVMAAEYSRDLAVKARAGQARVISMGFHMGLLPPLGYRRCSVSSDGRQRTILAISQRKLALTDRIEWVLAPSEEVELVRRICEAYARSSLDLWQIARLVAAEGWVTVRGQEVREKNLRALVRNEALIGNFVWGVSEQNANRRIIQSHPTRMDGSVPRIVDDTTWALMQRRLREPSNESLSVLRLPRSGRREKALQRLAQTSQEEVTRREYSIATRILALKRIRHAQEFGIALAKALNSEGVVATFDRRLHSVYVWGCRVRLKLMWPTRGDWRVPRTRCGGSEADLLLVKMQAEYQPSDFYFLPPRVAISNGASLASMTGKISAYQCTTPQILLDRIAALAMERAQRDAKPGHRLRP